MEPALSVILTTRDSFEVVRETVRHVVAQTIAKRIELVLVTPSRSTLAVDESAVNGLGCWQLVEEPSVRSVGHGNAVGVMSARAPIVLFAEDHAFPLSDCAERLLAAHQRPVVAVGPGIECANPVNAVSWADLIIGYGPWLVPAREGPVEFLPGHNSSYKRSALLRYGDQLPAFLEAETLLHWDMRQRGEVLWLEPRARVRHTNFARWDVWLGAMFHGGRVFAAARASRWDWRRRAMFVVGSPLIPVVRMWRLWSAVRRVGRWSALPALAVGLTADGVGQCCGYLLGAGRSAELVPQYEFNRRSVNERGLKGVGAGGKSSVEKAGVGAYKANR
ncbi:MAG: glycosyltransferase [Verrucomicrobiae bacterium]|nr:glycosyltransferase [Verrucomicrobiae bacterium]